MNNIDFLLTTISKTKNEIIALVKNNIGRGNVIVGNQLCKENGYDFYSDSNLTIQIYHLVTKGVSKNRNFLLSKSTANYVFFMDDDVKIIDYSFENLNLYSDFAYRFNLISQNFERPIKSISKNKFLKFNNLKSYGAWGILFNRSFLEKHAIQFDENIGPGSLINHGEDSLFLKSYLRIGKIYQINVCCFAVEQKESTWQGKGRNIELELMSQGYVYRALFGYNSYLFLVFHLIKHRKNYKDEGSILHNFLVAKKGIKLYLDSKKSNSLNN